MANINTSYTKNNIAPPSLYTLTQYVIENNSHAIIGDELPLTSADDNVDCTVTQAQKKRKVAINDMVCNKDKKILALRYIIGIQKTEIGLLNGDY